MIATVVFSAEEGVFKSVLVSDMGLATMHERARQILVWTRTGFEDVELVGGVRRGSQKRVEEARWLGRIQDGC